jgi:Bacterial regulatory proteins, luxR family
MPCRGPIFISEATVNTHLLHIYAKLEVRDRAAAVAAGYQRGLLTWRRQCWRSQRKGSYVHG